MGKVKKWTKMQRDQVVLLRKTGLSWPKISTQLDIPRSTCRGMWIEDSDGEVELPVLEPMVENAKVLKLVPTPRLMLIEFTERGGVERCVHRTRAHPPRPRRVRH